jgi:SAM-dependent methyltransferase
MLRSFLFFVARIIGKNNLMKLLKGLSAFSRRFARSMHQIQMTVQWGVEPVPEWFDHFCDQFYLFRENQTPFWVERGTFNLLAMKQGAEVLELCCGDGYNAYHFYSIRAKQVISVDFDKDAIPHAKKRNQAKNVTFQLCDIRTEMPEGTFDNIIWDAAIEHFTEVEIANVLTDIKKRLKQNGVVSGYTIVEKTDGKKSLVHHEYEFKSKEDLKRFFEPHFSNVKVFETKYPERHNLYFYASDGILPFDEQWEYIAVKKTI